VTLPVLSLPPIPEKQSHEAANNEKRIISNIQEMDGDGFKRAYASGP
jgi:hypothetical protein